MSTPAALSKADQLNARTLEVERSVLGGILIDSVQYDEARERLTPADFFRVPHRIVFAAFERLEHSSIAIDLTTLVQILTPEELEQAGGPSYLATLIDGVPHATNVRYYADRVRELATLRGIEQVARRLLNQASVEEDEPGALLEQAERALFQLRDRATVTSVHTPEMRARQTNDQVEALTAAKGALQGVSTGLRHLDTDLRGLRASNVIVLAGRPSMGKSAMAQTFAMAASAVGVALFFSLEMSVEEINLREVTTRAQVNSWHLMHGYVTPSQQFQLAQASGEMRDAAPYVVDAPTLTVGQIRAISRRVYAQHNGLSLIVIDYVQLITPESTSGRAQENRTLELGVMSRSLKGLARELHVPLVLLSQLNRDVDKRPDKRPMLSDLRESGALEQDADVVLLLYRPNAYEEIRKKHEYADSYVECNIAKQRNGPTGPVKLTFIREHTRFTDYEESAPQGPQQQALA